MFSASPQPGNMRTQPPPSCSEQPCPHGFLNDTLKFNAQAAARHVSHAFCFQLLSSVCLYAQELGSAWPLGLESKCGTRQSHTLTHAQTLNSVHTAHMPTLEGGWGCAPLWVILQGRATLPTCLVIQVRWHRWNARIWCEVSWERTLEFSLQA